MRAAYMPLCSEKFRRGIMEGWNENRQRGCGRLQGGRICDGVMREVATIGTIEFCRIVLVFADRNCAIMYKDKT